jgi:crotonobetainyl-CoA:carnitine CoA-transferase CaiB-like acyl-CoA transferase
MACLSRAFDALVREEVFELSDVVLCASLYVRNPDHISTLAEASMMPELHRALSALSGLVNHSSAYVADGVVPLRMGNAHPSLFPYEPVPTADGELIITAGNDGQFRKLCDVLGIPDLIDDPRFAHNQDRTANREQLRPLLVERLATRSKMEWFRDLTAAGVPCGPINTIDGGVAFAEEMGLDPVVDAGHGEHAVPGIRNPIRFSHTPPRYELPPPVLDEHGAQIRRWLTDPDATRPRSAPIHATVTTGGTDAQQ